jgi:excisionase family DNA binding protein
MTELLPEPLLTPEQVAGRLNVQKSWVYRAARNGTIPAVNVGRWVRFRIEDVEAFIATGGADDE